MRIAILIVALGTILFSFGAATAWGQGLSESETPALLQAAQDSTNPSIDLIIYSPATPYTTDNPFSVWVYASDNVAVASVTWENDRGSNGTCTYDGNSYFAEVQLYDGVNNVTFVVSDSSGNTKSKAIEPITYVNIIDLPSVSNPNPADGATITAGNSGQPLCVTSSGATSGIFYFGIDQANMTSTAAIIVGDYVQTVVPYSPEYMTDDGVNYWYVEITNGYGTTRYPESGVLSFTVGTPVISPFLNLLLQ